MDTNTLLIIVTVIFLCAGFGFYGRGRWFRTDAALSRRYGFLEPMTVPACRLRQVASKGRLRS